MINIFKHKKHIEPTTTEDENTPLTEGVNNSTPDQEKSRKNIKLSEIVGGKILLRKFMLSQIPLMIMIVAYSIAMVSNRYYIENTSVDIKNLQKEINELNIKHVQFECDYMNIIMISEVAKKLEPLGIYQSTDRPLKIKIEK